MVVLVLCFVKVMKPGVRCNSTYLANRKGGYDHQLWRRMARDSKSLNLKQLAVSIQTLSHKRAKYCATDKI